MSTTYQIAVTFRGPRDVRKDATRTTDDLSQVAELLGKGPDGWTVAYLTIIEVAPQEGGENG